ncbi:MAG TPA: hypothetical protein VF698_18075, partial [Thermoanaerobaculia bacterium]
MSSRFPSAALALLLVFCGAPPRPATQRVAAADRGAPARTLRVCADPNNLPFSNERREGFENRI